MRLILVVLVLVLAAAVPGQAQSAALDMCIKTALKHLLAFKSVVDQRDIRDRSGKVTGQQILMRVNALGKDAQVICIYDAAKAVAVIEASRPGSTAPAAAGSPREAAAACTAAVQQQRLMMDNIVSQADVRNARGQVTGRSLIINVFQRGRPAQVQCGYDYASRQAGLQLQRPEFR